MKSQILLSLTTLALASDLSPPLHLAQKRAVEGLVPRQTDIAEATACLSSLFAFYSTMPTPPPELANLEEVEIDEDAITDLCSYTPPASVAPAFSSWANEISSWVDETLPKISSVLAGCPEYASAVDEVTSAYKDICTDGGIFGGGSEATPTSGSGPAETGAGGAGAGAGSQTGTGAGAQQTAGAVKQGGVVAGVLAAAGVVGAALL